MAVTIAMINTRQAPINANGFLSAHLNKIALTKECIQFRQIMATNEKKTAKREKKNGKKAIMAIKFRGMQFNAQTANERAKTDKVNRTNDDFATEEANGNTIQNKGTEKISNRSKKMLEIISKPKKFEISNEIADATRPAAQISRNIFRQRINEPKHKTTLAKNKTK